MAKTTKCETCLTVKTANNWVAGLDICQKCFDKRVADLAFKLAHANGEHTKPVQDCLTCCQEVKEKKEAARVAMRQAVVKKVLPLFRSLPSVMPMCFADENREAVAEVDGIARNQAEWRLHHAIERLNQSGECSLEVGTSFDNRCEMSFRLKFDLCELGSRKPVIDVGVGYGAHGASDLSTVRTRIALIEKVAEFMGVVELTAKATLSTQVQKDQRQGLYGY